MPDIWVPNEELNPVIEEMESRAEARRFTDFRNRLQALDPRLGGFLNTVEDPARNLKQGFYYIYRRNDDGTTTTWIVQNPDSSFREPDQAILDAFQKGDAARGNLSREWKRAEDKRRKARESAKAFQEEENRDKLKDQFDYHFRVQMPVKDRAPWK